MTKKLLCTAILTLSSAFASTINHQGVDLTRGMKIDFTADGAARTSTAGVGRILVDGTTIVESFCANLFELIYVGTDYAAVSVAASSYDSDGGAIAWLMSNYLPVVNAASAGLLRQQNGAALQLAIWDVVHDSGDGFGAGRIQSAAGTDATVLALANSWRLAAAGQSASGSIFNAPPDATAFQEQLYIPSGDVPEPGTMAMLAVGGLAILLRKRLA